MNIDLLDWSGQAPKNLDWKYGHAGCIPGKLDEAFFFISQWIVQSQADFILFWHNHRELPAGSILESLIQENLDIAHCGLLEGLGECWPDLCTLGSSWDQLNAPSRLASSNWRLGLDASLIRRKVFLQAGGLDPIFESWTGAGLELGYRCLKLGAVIEHRPELVQGDSTFSSLPPTPYDLYCFVLRHYGLHWSQYFFLRRMLFKGRWSSEWKYFQLAHRACQDQPPGWSYERPLSLSLHNVDLRTVQDAQISVIIPTLGRYAYLPVALDSLKRQSIRPHEVIVVDQNPPQARRLDIYEGYEGLNLKVLYQDERGQSLARNTGLAAAQGKYVFLFDDDSIATPDLLEQHLVSIVFGQFAVSTGVSVPPSPTTYILPPQFRYKRLAQTFDTGNAMLSLALARQMGGLDRNYDFGPGTDADFGTRLYLAGYRILHNADAVRVHFKAPIGGLRIYGSKKYNTDTGLLHPYPPVTQSYYALRYLSSRQAREVAWLGFFLNKFPRELRHSEKSIFKHVIALSHFLVGLIFLPIKRWRSIKKARKLFVNGIRLMQFDDADQSRLL